MSRSRRTRSASVRRRQMPYPALILHPLPTLTKYPLERRPRKGCFPGGADRARALPDRRLSDARRGEGSWGGLPGGGCRCARDRGPLLRPARRWADDTGHDDAGAGELGRPRLLPGARFDVLGKGARGLLALLQRDLRQGGRAFLAGGGSGRGLGARDPRPTRRRGGPVRRACSSGRRRLLPARRADLDRRARLARRRDGDRVRVLRLRGRGNGGARHPAVRRSRASETGACGDRCARCPGIRNRFCRGRRRGRRGGRWDHHRKQADAARRGGRGAAGRRVAARGARSDFRGREGGGLEIRNWLSKRREYSRSAPETESGVGPMDSVFTKCERCGQPIYEKDLRARFNVCPNCEFHYPLSAPERIRLLTDAGSFEERDGSILADDPLGFEDYQQRLQKARTKTGLDDAVLSGTGVIGGKQVALAVLDFRFIGGSMGSVVGEKVARTIEVAGAEELPLVIVSASGGARMFEGVYSLMQMAKTSVTLSRYVEGCCPYVSVLTDPTFGGVTASFATAADVVLAEPGARIGFTGARVIEQTTKERLPESFQTAEFQREHGMVDRIVHRLSLKGDLERLLGFLP